MSQLNNEQEEVDLGSLFILIGKAFTKLINFITSIFRGLFDFIIQILLFLKGNIIKIGGEWYFVERYSIQNYSLTGFSKYPKIITLRCQGL